MASDVRPFLKMNGLGNDFVVWDARQKPLQLAKDQIAQLGDRGHGIGFDQMITVERSAYGVDAFMRIHNCDGSQVDACGNATRCIGRLLMEEAGKDMVTIETNAGLLHAFDADGPRTVTVDMGVPRLEWDQIPLAEEFADTRAIELQIGPIDEPILHTPAVVNMGNPHAIFWVDDVEAYDLARVGPLLEHHPIFPEGANISLAHVFDENQIRLKVWERGAGLTLACGTAACATAVAAVRDNKAGRKTTIHLPGGPIDIEWRESDGHVLMTGLTEIEFEGEVDLATLSWRRTEDGDVPVEAGAAS
ncbi:diaminopimelate epimerase [Roseibium denhamense]|uniref:Diaminopimelate epimerase n=1 Tax=Roseibium denhamense TaxID=76305 RepID=A0ABY1PB48_9HYPH|nr:diaminopimelate epimerase [Roseibium denhamense]MTI07498.1 diaminopimelate epimerase [Roseibium denhamense]SMP30035.1 diaminopimelate epimerase [Roseibium denhamense]